MTSTPRCLRCAYDLAGVPDHGACPECGLALAVTRRGALMLTAPGAYLDALQRGLFASAAGMLIVGVGQALWGGPDPVGLRIMRSDASTKAIRITITIGMFVWLYGLWRTTQPNPLDRAADLYKRTSLRLVLAAAAIGAAVSLLEVITRGTPATNLIKSPPWMRWCFRFTAYGMPAAFLVAFWLHLTIVHRLAVGRVVLALYACVNALAGALLLGGAITTASGFLVYWNRFGAREYFEHRDLLIWPWSALLAGLALYAAALTWLWWRLRSVRGSAADAQDLVPDR